MKVKEHRTIVLTLAIVGMCVILYFAWQGYQHYASEQQTRSFFNAPPQGPAAGLYQPSKKPPPQ
jgi:cytochrome c-type biogenesis protein CcmH/NrfG